MTDIKTTAPVTITLDIAALAQHLVPDYDSEPTGRWEDGDGPEPMGALDGILRHVAALLVKDIRKEYVARAAQHALDAVSQEVDLIVRDVLDEGGVIGDGYSAKKTKPLRELIRDEVLSWTTKAVGDSYSRPQQTALQALVRTEVDKALKADLAEVKEAERAKFREAIRTTAAALLADDATRRR